MSGTIRGKVECYFGFRSWAGYREIVQEVFTAIYKYFKVHPNMTEVARHGGVGSTASSVNYWDETYPFTNNAWFVFKMNTVTENPLYIGSRTFPWYVLVQWNRDDQANFGTAPGSPGKCENNTNIDSLNCRIGIQFAIGIGGDQNPWNGTGTLGQNVKGTPVWKTPTGGTGVIVYPRSNNIGGAHATNKENTTHIVFRSNSNPNSPAKCHIIMDDDHFIFLWDAFYGETYSLCYFGTFVPRPDLTFDYPYVLLNTVTGGLPIYRGNTYGSTSGTGYASDNPCNGGGIPAPNPAVNGVKGLVIERYQTFFDNAFLNHNKYFNPPVFDEYPISIAMYEYPNWYGYAGQIDFIKETSGPEARCRTTGTGTRLIVGGSTSLTNVKLSVPWPASVNPGIGLTREGLVF